MTDFDKGKMFLRLSPDDLRAGEHGARAGEKDDYTPVIPVPKDAPAPDWNKLRPTDATGDPVRTWRYHTAENELARYVARWKPKDPNDPKEKVIRPATWNGTEWKLKGMPAPRPLYGLPAILESPDKFVIVVEGETCADAGLDVFPAHIVTTWEGGSGAEDKTDWSPLAGRTVLLLADRDAPGRKAMKRIADELAGMGANVSVHLPDGDDKQDIANGLKEDGDEVTRIRIEKEAKPWIETDSHAAVRLAALSPMEYDRVRKGEAKRLRRQQEEACERVHGKAFAADKAGFPATAHHFLEHHPQDIALPETAMVIDREGRVIRYPVFQPKPAEPAIGQIQLDLLAEPPFRTDRIAVAHQQHPDHQLGADRGAAGVAVEGRYR